jgi:hypothetical protein
MGIEATVMQQSADKGLLMVQTFHLFRGHVWREAWDTTKAVDKMSAVVKKASAF